MKVLVIGANGQLGSDIVHAFQDKEVISQNQEDIEVTDPDSVRASLEEHRPDVVINTAAYLRVDEVEGNPERAFAVNAIAPWRMALLCQDVGAAMVFISTDYVFGGDRKRYIPYTENDLPAPLNVYGASKAGGENLVRTATRRHFIIRTSGLYGLKGASGKGGNFVKTMLRRAEAGDQIRVVNDQRLTPTFTQDVAQALNALFETNRYGLYHITNGGDCTWYEFAAKIFELSGLHPNFAPSTSSEFKTNAQRPGYSVLANEGLAAAGLTPMRPWEEALEDFLGQSTQPKKEKIIIPAASFIP